jgi:hypothetical protein
MKHLLHENYNLNPYSFKRIFMFWYGLYYENTLLLYGGYSRIREMSIMLNGAFINGVAHCIVVNSNSSENK